MRAQKNFLPHFTEPSAFITRLFLAICILSAGALEACAPAAARFELVFPAAEPFLLAEKAQIEVYQSTEPDALCTALALGQPTSDNVLARSDEASVCAFQAGEVQLAALPAEVLVFSAVVSDGQGEIILRGCKTAALAQEYIDSDGLLLKIPLAITAAYPANLELEPTCAALNETDTAQKCTSDLRCDPRTL